MNRESRFDRINLPYNMTTFSFTVSTAFEVNRNDYCEEYNLCADNYFDVDTSQSMGSKCLPRVNFWTDFTKKNVTFRTKAPKV